MSSCLHTHCWNKHRGRVKHFESGHHLQLHQHWHYPPHGPVIHPADDCIRWEHILILLETLKLWITHLWSPGQHFLTTVLCFTWITLTIKSAGEAHSVYSTFSPSEHFNALTPFLLLNQTAPLTIYADKSVLHIILWSCHMLICNFRTLSSV